MDFAVPADHRVKVKESKNLKSLCNMIVTVIPVIIRVLGTIH